MNDLKSVAPALAAPGYEDDLVAWTEHQITLLRERCFAQMDIDNLLEELEAMVRRDRRELRSRLAVVLIHLLKCQFQPEHKSHGWLGSLGEQRFRIELLLQESPSLRRLVAEYGGDVYRSAAAMAASETGLPISVFPSSIPYSVDELLDPTFIP